MLRVFSQIGEGKGILKMGIRKEETHAWVMWRLGAGGAALNIRYELHATIQFFSHPISNTNRQFGLPSDKENHRDQCPDL